LGLVSGLSVFPCLVLQCWGVCLCVSFWEAGGWVSFFGVVLREDRCVVDERAGGAVVGGSVRGRPAHYGPFLVRCERFVKAVRDGDSYRDACRYAGWKDRSSLRRARQVLPGFTARIEEARELGRAEWSAALESRAGRWDPWEGRDPSDLVGEKWRRR
jgi:hypothetical protein